MLDKSVYMENKEYIKSKKRNLKEQDLLYLLNNKFNMQEKQYLQTIQEKIKNSTNESEKAYYKRMITLLAEPNLTEIEPHPVKDIVDKIVNSDYYKGFKIVKSPEIVNEYATFDLFFFPKNHVARRPSDSFFIEKKEDTKNSILLRPHTTVIWYYYLLEQGGKEKLEKN